MFPITKYYEEIRIEKFIHSAGYNRFHDNENIKNLRKLRPVVDLNH